MHIYLDKVIFRCHFIYGGGVAYFISNIAPYDITLIIYSCINFFLIYSRFNFIHASIGTIMYVSYTTFRMHVDCILFLFWFRQVRQTCIILHLNQQAPVPTNRNSKTQSFVIHNISQVKPTDQVPSSIHNSATCIKHNALNPNVIYFAVAIEDKLTIVQKDNKRCFWTPHLLCLILTHFWFVF